MKENITPPARAPRKLVASDSDNKLERDDLLCKLIAFLLSLDSAYRDERQATTLADERVRAREDAL